MLALTRGHVERLLDMRSCIDAVETAFCARATGSGARSALAGVSLERGKLHAKLATLYGTEAYAVAKVNANIPANPVTTGLPAIQGALLLFDAETGVPLAVMDSISITAIRTAATSAVACKWLALPDASSLAVIGCGAQARAHVEAMMDVRPIRRLRAFDLNPSAAKAFCAEMRTVHGLQCDTSSTAAEAARESQVVVTATPSRQPILEVGDVQAGTFIAAVGADSEDKQELSPQLLRTAAIIVDDLEQCVKIGDLHHAIAARALGIADVRASLDQIVSRQIAGRRDDREIVVFDSTGVAIEDAAAAALVYERAKAAGVGTAIDLATAALPAAVTARSSS